MNNFYKSVFAIPLVSLSLVGLNFSSAVFANNSKFVNSNNTQQPRILLAQQQTCSVVNIQSGQLALRFSPNGNSRAGLNNGNTVAFLKSGSFPWAYVRVINGPNNGVNGLEGWVNSNYLSCGEISEVRESPQVFCNVTNIQTGQLALRFSPNGKSRAGLNNGNTIQFLRRGNGPWVYVRVMQGPNLAVNGLEGWVNANYLSCYGF
ncbi:SH3 domain-containing protein [Calothrix sp. FACHB-1219]|uniref:SH3 domain-containing protein n=1 Tax=unclassified Calothrix TaxID=2619626 RepID=UPI001681DE48|nr:MULTISPECIES: SH3 domain-containing protein [unclassified Calothrix]MBD2205429.1 SH3 domain-containing protein [Calothrix sp. FACHB-168]MBD2218560.1 SH3 domain-containing protein [Calothrix sp. FACHB-1219]